MRYYFGFLLALICWSCTLDKQEITEYVFGDSKTYSFSVDAALNDINIEDNNEDTRASAESVIRLTWAEDDALSVINLTKGKVLGGQLKATANGDRIKFIGTLSGTIDETDKLAFIYPSLNNTDEEVFTRYDFDYSWQNGSSKVPFCAYRVVSVSELSRSESTFSVSSLTLNFAMAYIRMNLCDLPNSTQIKRIEIENLGSNLNLTINTEKNEFVRTSTTGDITLTPTNLNATNKGYQVVYITCAESEAQSLRRKVNIYTEDKKFSSDMASSAFPFLRNLNTIVGDFVQTGRCINGFEYVDLGLKRKDVYGTDCDNPNNRIVFAPRNLGAFDPEDAGFYFQWGDLKGWNLKFDSKSLKILTGSQYDKNGKITEKWPNSAFFDSYLNGNDLSYYSSVFAGENAVFVGKIDETKGYGDAATYYCGGSWTMMDHTLIGCIITHSSETESYGDFNIGDIELNKRWDDTKKGIIIENEILETSIFLPATSFIWGNYKQSSYINEGYYWDPWRRQNYSSWLWFAPPEHRSYLKLGFQSDSDTQHAKCIRAVAEIEE